jgi:hypothetical protein
MPSPVYRRRLRTEPRSSRTGEQRILLAEPRAVLPDGDPGEVLVVGEDGQATFQPIPTEYTLYGYDAGAGVTAIELGMDGGLLIAGEPGVPVNNAMTANTVAASWVSDTVPAGSWTLTLQRRAAGDTAFSDIATATINTS